MALKLDNPRWWQLDGAELARALRSLVDGLKWYADENRRRALASTRLYEGRAVAGLDGASYCNDARVYFDGNCAGDAPELVVNVARSLAATATAKVAGLQKPKVQFMCTGADWQVRRRSKKLDKAVEAQFYQTQGRYENLWDLTAQAFCDCTVWGEGVIKVYADPDQGKVVYERVFPWELLVDPEEARYGQPVNLIHRFAYDRDRLLDVYPEHSSAIREADVFLDDVIGRATARASDPVEVIEAWRLPISTSSPGRHTIAVGDTVLFDEDYDRPEFPFVRVPWAWELIGSGSKSLVEEVEGLCAEVNISMARMQAGQRMTGKAICLVPTGSVAREDVDSNADATVIEYTGAVPPTWVSPPGFGTQDVEYLQLCRQMAFEISGVPQAAASSKKEPGVTAGVALRAIADMTTERFAVVTSHYESLFVALARHTVAAMRELATEDPDFSTNWPGGEFLQTIRWSDADVEDNQYIVRIAPVSGRKNTPADRLQLAQELMSAGAISPDAFLRITQYLDTESELEAGNRQHEYVGRLIEEWLDATPETAEDGTFRFRPPIPFLPSLPSALVQVAEAYLNAELDGAPDWNLEHFRRYMTELDQRIQERQAAAAAAAAPQAAAPQAAAPPPMGG